MQLQVTSVDYSPEELYDQVPFTFKLIREIPGSDRPDYWIGECEKPIRWIHDNFEKYIKYVVVAARWEGTEIAPNVKELPIAISYVTDESVLTDKELDFKKCSYVAIGLAHETEGGPPPKKSNRILSGTIGRFFGVGNQKST